jgi:hypothetical protein
MGMVWMTMAATEPMMVPAISSNSLLSGWP